MAEEYDVLDSQIHEAVGAASTCWEDGKVPTGVFDDKRAREIAHALREVVDKHTEKRVQEAREDERRKLLEKAVGGSAVHPNQTDNRPFVIRLETYHFKTYDSIVSPGSPEDIEDARNLLSHVVGDESGNIGFDTEEGRVCVPAKDVEAGRIVFMETAGSRGAQDL